MMTTFYLICFVLGFVLSVLAAFSGLGRLHIGHLHLGHARTHVHAEAKTGSHVSALNGFTLPAFLCWFGGAGYLLHQYSSLLAPLVLLVAVVSGLLGAGILYMALFKFLLSKERVLSVEDTRMDGVVGRVSDEIRMGGTGEILFSQSDARRSAAARSDSGLPIPRGTEVVVMRYSRGIAFVRPLEELLEPSASNSTSTFNQQA
jgi:membrane protein implicated in regulation of membrane protease activity